jgi:hypothetical protein
VTPRLEARIRSDFAAEEAELVLDELDALALPLVDGPAPERIQAAIVVLAGGDLARFDEAARIARIDWRDVLVASGLGNHDWPARLELELAADGDGG